MAYILLHSNAMNKIITITILLMTIACNLLAAEKSDLNDIKKPNIGFHFCYHQNEFDLDDPQGDLSLLEVDIIHRKSPEAILIVL